MVKSKEKCIFLDEMGEDGGFLLQKELVLRGYRLLPLAGNGILVIGGEDGWK